MRGRRRGFTQSLHCGPHFPIEHLWQSLYILFVVNRREDNGMTRKPDPARQPISTRLIFARQQFARFIAGTGKRRPDADAGRKHKPDLLFPIALAALAAIALAGLIHLFVSEAG
jgi:hypothetical protein